MYEVFDYISGETLGFTDSLVDVYRYLGRSNVLDYIDADAEEAGGPYPI